MTSEKTDNQPTVDHPGDMAWKDGHVPFSTRFDDIYYSPENGMAESRFVFTNHCRLSGDERLPLPEGRPLFVGETGFGTGLNFLTLWHALDQDALVGGTPKPAIAFQSTELHPLNIEDHCKAVMFWESALGDKARAFCNALRSANQDGNCLRLDFDDGRVSLHVAYRDVVPGITAFPHQVDAWFLDGFAPAKNPDMWQQPVFDAMASKSRPNARFSTFTAAGFVKRGLRQAGFVTEKTRGFGRKRDMLRGYYDPAEAAALYA